MCTLYPYLVKKPSMDPTHVILFVLHEIKMSARIFIIIFYQTLCDKVRSAGRSFMLLLSHNGQPHVCYLFVTLAKQHNIDPMTYLFNGVKYNSTLDIQIQFVQ